MLVVIIFLFSFCQSARAEITKQTLTGDIRFHYDFLAEKLNNKRTIAVYLPPGYEEDKLVRYPVLYMHDGQNIFDTSTSFIGKEWRVDETVQRLIQEGKIQKIIVVGIYNNADRIAEYTPWSDSEHGGGKAGLYADFILHDLKPFIDKTYRTLPDRKNTAVCGSSLGGIISYYLMWNFPEVFSKGAIVSPAVWWANKSIIKEIQKTNINKQLKIWLDMGTKEGKTVKSFQNAVKDVRLLKDAFIANGFVLDRNLAYFEDKDAVHNEAAWAGRMPAILEFLFKKK